MLRVLQHHEVERVGGTEPVPVDVRLISATHRNLEELVRVGSFRKDLWFRINLFPIQIPPLRQRTEDIPALVAHFLERKGKKLMIRTPPRPRGLWNSSRHTTGRAMCGSWKTWWKGR
nr:sigma 54-interacting transcriptional regulator [Desulfatitalea alkaliphila]